MLSIICVSKSTSCGFFGDKIKFLLVGEDIYRFYISTNCNDQALSFSLTVQSSETKSQESD